MPNLTPTSLYGGAILCPLPSSFIDSSTLREVPSHQEVFLSPTTLTSIIIEINQHETSTTSDIDAAIYHYRDVVDPADVVSNSTQPVAVTMRKDSLAGFPALIMSGMVVSREKGKADSSGSVLPAEWEQTPSTQMVEVQTMMYQLLVRMKMVETDLCVRINVPLKEFEGEAGEKEMVFGKECLEKMVEGLDVKDFGLFEG
jgi:hypothetical protein